MIIESDQPFFQPISLRATKLQNRFVMSPMTRGFSPKGVPGPDVARYYQRRAAADVGLIITEGIGIDHPSAIGSGSLEEEDIPLLIPGASAEGWRGVVDAVHGAGGTIIPQLWHMGVMRREGTGPFPQSPSSRPSGIWGKDGPNIYLPPEYVAQVLSPTRPMSDSEVADVIAAYGRSASIARDVGFDGIAIHAAHGYLIDTFFWDCTNQRNDRWGGDWKGRTQFAVETVQEIRRAVGPDLPIVFRYSQWKQQDYMAKLVETPHQLEALLGPLADAGVDVFDVSTRNFDHPAFDGSPLSLAGWTRKLTGVTTMAVGGIGVGKDVISAIMSGGVTGVDNLAKVEAMMERGEFDLVGVGRALLADAEWVRKIKLGQAIGFTSEEYGNAYAALT